MEAIKISDIAKAVGGTVSGCINNSIDRICTDSRCIEPGCLFVAIEGERFDGHDYVAEAFLKGANAALVHKKFLNHSNDKTVIQVPNTLTALGDIASWYRQRFSIPVVAVTGSVGKTSTKGMIASVLEQEFNVLKNKGNFNNEIGLPLTIFELDKSHTAAVLEMGMSGLGEVKRLSNIARPDVGIITNIGFSHIEKLGSRQNILRAKMEIIEGLNPEGTLILNGDDELLSGVRGLIRHRTIFYGMNENADVQAYDIQSHGEKGSTFNINIGHVEYTVSVPVPGLHNVYNALAAICSGIVLKMDMDAVISGIEEYRQEQMRLDIVEYNGVKIINDSYNASPQSMKAALSVLRELGTNKRTIALLADMLEMGDWAKDAHIDVGKAVVQEEIEVLFTVGANGKYIAEGAMKAGMPYAKVFSFDSNKDASKALESFLTDGDILLVKGSRGMQTEEIVKHLIHIKNG